MRDLSSGEVRRLTQDGEPQFGYGDVDPSYDRQGVARRRANQPSPLHFRRISLAGDAAAPNSQLVVVDTNTLAPQALALDPQALNDLALNYSIEDIVWWSAEGDRLFLVTANRGGSRYALNAVALATGQTTEILHETARFNVRLNPLDYARPNVYVTSNGAVVIWYSERSGCGHLYLHDASDGRLKRQLTRGDWVV